MSYLGVGVSPGNVPVYHGSNLKVIDRRVRLAELVLRFLICGLGVLSAVRVVSDTQVREIFTIQKRAKFTDMKALVFLVVANGLAAAYSLVQGLRCIVCMVRGSVLFNKPLAWAIFSGDQLMAYLTLAAVAAAAQSAVFAKLGEPELQWMKICDIKKMENQGSNKKYIQMRPQRRPLGIAKILSEAHKITIKNRKLAVWIILSVLVSYTILGFCSHLLLESVTEDLSAALKSNYYSDPTDSTIGTFTQGDLKDLRYYVGIQLVFLFIDCVILLIFVVASIYSSSEAYIGNVLSLKDTLLGIKGRIKRPIITSFLMALISFGLVCFILILFWIILLMTQGDYIYLPITLAAILGVVCYVYVGALWMLSLVVSVLEEDKYCCGLKAIDRASEIMKGKRIQGSVLNLIFIIIIGVIDVVFFFASWKANKVSLELTVIMIPRILLICLVKLFKFEVFTVFYHERKRSQEPESELSLSALSGDTGGEA